MTRAMLADVTVVYGQFNERYQQAARRGDYERADEALSVMQEIERCVVINELSTAWRRTVAKIRLREAEAQR